MRVGIPPPDRTQVAELARVAGTRGVFVAFQGATAVLLLAAASSSFQAGPGLFKALARRQVEGGGQAGILPCWMGVRNRYHTPYWSVALFVVGSAAVVLAAGGQDQILVLCYAVAVFIAFLSGLVAMARSSFTDHAWGALATNVLGMLVVAFTLTVNLTRLYPLASFGAAVLIGGLLFGLWVRAGRPRGIAGALAASEG